MLRLLMLLLLLVLVVLLVLLVLGVVVRSGRLCVVRTMRRCRSVCVRSHNTQDG
jgi:hypothetical protein